MKKRIFAVLLSFILIFLFTGCEPKIGGQLSQKEKLEDFNYMYEVIKDGYPFLEVNKRLNNIDWLVNKEKYEELVQKTGNDEDFINVLNNIVKDLKNGHTHIIQPKDSYMFDLLKNGYEPLGWYDFFEDSKVIERYDQDEKETSSSKSKNEMNKIIAKDLILTDTIDGKVGYMHLPQMGRSNSPIEDDIKLIGKYLVGLDNHQALIIDIRGNSGGSDLYWKNIVSMLVDKPMPVDGFVLFRSGEVIDNYAQRREISLNNINNLVALKLENIPTEVATSFNGYVKLENTIPSNKVSNFNGNIYLLVDGSVYSSSESFAIFAKDTGFATLIGQRTGGDGGGFDPVLFALPNSGIIARMSADMYLTPRGICNEEHKTTPDYVIDDVTIRNQPGSFANDKCIQKVLELEKLN